MAKPRFITFGERVKTLRQELALSQEALGAQGFVSTPGWIKIENGQRQASEKLIEQLVKWLVADKYVRANAAAVLREELLALKYMGSRSPFLQELARTHVKQMPSGEKLTSLAPPATARTGRKHGKTPKSGK